jgi:hypothetical protein
VRQCQFAWAGRGGCALRLGDLKTEGGGEKRVVSECAKRESRARVICLCACVHTQGQDENKENKRELWVLELCMHLRKHVRAQLHACMYCVNECMQ